MHFSYYKFPTLLNKSTKAILSALRFKMECDLSVTMIASSTNFYRYIDTIKERIRSEYYKFLDLLRSPIRDLYRTFHRNDSIAIELTERDLNHFKENFEKLLSKTKEIVPATKTYNKLREMMKKSSNIQALTNISIGEISMGDKFHGIHGSTIVNRSLVEGAFNSIKDDFNEETADAIKRLAEFIEKSGNREAVDNFDSFNEELLKPEPKKAVLRSLWNGITSALPSILQITDVATKITKLFD